MGRETESLQPEDLIRYVPAHVITRIAQGKSAVAFGETIRPRLFADTPASRPSLNGSRHAAAMAFEELTRFSIHISAGSSRSSSVTAETSSICRRLVARVLAGR